MPFAEIEIVSQPEPSTKFSPDETSPNNRAPDFDTKAAVDEVIAKNATVHRLLVLFLRAEAAAEAKLTSLSPGSRTG